MVTTTSGPSGDTDTGDGMPWQHLAADDYHRHLTTLEGWRQFTATAYQPPGLLPRERTRRSTSASANAEICRDCWHIGEGVPHHASGADAGTRFAAVNTVRK